MHDHHDHSSATHSAQCDEEGCGFVAQVHSHDDDSAVRGLSHSLAEHNKAEHGKDTDPEAIKKEVAAKMKVLS